MATVRITNQLVNDARSRVDSLYRTANNEHNKREPSFMEMYGKHVTPRTIMEAIWREHYNLMLAMPEEWMQEPESFTFRAQNSVGNTVTFTMRNNFSGDKLPVPPRYETWNGAKVGFIPPDSEFAVAYQAWDKEGRELRVKYAEIADNVENALRSYPTLNRALGANPELRHVIPQAYLDDVARIEEKKPKAAKVEREVVSLDKGALVSAVALTNLVD